MRSLLKFIPMVRRESIFLDNEGLPVENKSHFEAKAWVFEWFGLGFIFYIGEVFPVKQTERR